MTERDPPRAVTFDLFGTLVTARRPDDPATAVAAELEERGVAVPPDWSEAYATPLICVEPGEELPLPEHVRAVLAENSDLPDTPTKRGTDGKDPIAAAVKAAFDRPVTRRDGALGVIQAARECGPVGLLSNCSVPGLVEQTIEQTGLESQFDAVFASVDLGVRKPDARAFEAVAKRLGVPTEDLVHVGDDPRTDGGVDRVGGRALLLEDLTLDEITAQLGRECS